MRRLVLSLLMLVALTTQCFAQAVPQVKVLTTFSVLGDMVKQVGGDFVLVGALASAPRDIEKYQPQDEDAKAIEVADLIIANGLQLEDLWLPYMLTSNKAEAKLVVASKGITPIMLKNAKGEQEPDPHAWQSVPNAIKYVENIRDALIAKDALHADNYRNNADKYLRDLRALDAWMRAKLGLIAAEDRGLIINRDALAYFAAEYAVKVMPMNTLGKTTKPDHLPKAFFLDNVAEAKSMQKLQAQKMTFGGKLYTNSLANQPPADTYIGMMRWNVSAITDTLLPPKPAATPAPAPAEPTTK